MTITPSPQQDNFYLWVNEGVGSCVLEAVAGSGKTTTLVTALQLMSGSIFFGAYNKKIVEDISAKVKPNPMLNISTMHSAGMQAVRKSIGNVKVDSNKCDDIFRDAVSRYPEYGIYQSAVLKLVSYAKQAAIGVVDDYAEYSSWKELIRHYDVDCLDNETLVIQLAIKTLEKSISLDSTVIDFDDMIYVPLYHKLIMKQYDWVLIDEAQDTNLSRRLLALKMLKKAGRMVAVGDRHQAIYGFTGADHKALDEIAVATNAIRMPLTVSFRCPKKVIEVAQKYVSHIQAADTAAEGIVNYAREEDITKVVQPGDAVLVRFNAPTVKYVYQFIMKGIPARVEGKDVGKGLQALVNRFKNKNLIDFNDALDAYYDKECAKLILKDEKSSEKRIAALTDRVDCIKIIRDRVVKLNLKGYIAALISAELEKIFGAEDEKKSVVTLSTIHKSKGREFKRVCFVDMGPSPYSKLDWEKEQETNLYYVAVTRAMEELHIVKVAR